MLSARTGTWDCELLNRLALPTGLLPEIIPAGSTVGRIRAELAAELGIDPVPVIAPATHDTGSAVAGAPIDEGWAYISSGTWSLVGIERSEALINDRGRAPQLHERRRSVWHDSFFEERDGPVDSGVSAGKNGSGTESSLITMFCCVRSRQSKTTRR